MPGVEPSHAHGPAVVGISFRSSMISTLHCLQCETALEFETECPPEKIECPNCRYANRVIMNRTVRHGKPWYPEGALRDSIDPAMIRIGYTMAILIPLAGFFFGIYLMAKKQSGHGCACMAISLFVSTIIMWMFL
jgi:hypothetical protein